MVDKKENEMTSYVAEEKPKFYSRIEIKSASGVADRPSAQTSLFINGHKVDGVRSMTYRCEVGALPTLTIDLNAIDISIDQSVVLYQKNMGNIKAIVFDED